MYADKNIKRRKVRIELWPYVKAELEKENISYGYDGAEELSTTLSSAKYHRIIERAMCKEQQEKTISKIPVVSYKMWCDGELPTEKRSFCFLKKDIEAFHKELGIEDDSV